MCLKIKSMVEKWNFVKLKAKATLNCMKRKPIK